MTNPEGKQLKLSSYAPADNYLSGRNILVTGAGSGIGKAVAIAMAGYGATITLLGRTEKKLEKTYDEIESNGGPQAAICPLDLQKADEMAYQQLANILNTNFSQLDGIVHCAATLGSHSPIVNSDYPLWQSVLQVNLTAAYLITKACYPLLISSDAANVIFTSDNVAAKGQAYWGAYSVSKAGIDNLMQILASEWETNTAIHVNSLDPGPASTALRKLVYPGENTASLPRPDDTVLPYLYLFDRQNTDISGQRLRWDSQLKSLSET